MWVLPNVLPLLAFRPLALALILCFLFSTLFWFFQISIFSDSSYKLSSVVGSPVYCPVSLHCPSGSSEADNFECFKYPNSQSTAHCSKFPPCVALPVGVSCTAPISPFVFVAPSDPSQTRTFLLVQLSLLLLPSQPNFFVQFFFVLLSHLFHFGIAVAFFCITLNFCTD